MANFNGLKMVGDFWDSETIMKTYWPLMQSSGVGWYMYTTQVDRGCPDQKK